MASELSLPALLQKIVALACTVADARYGALGVLGSEGKIQDFITHGITQAERDAIGRLPVGRGILGVLINEAHPLRLRRISDDPRSVGFPANHPPMTSFLGVPVRVRDRVYGNLYLTEKRGAEQFTEDDEWAVITLAAHAGVAIENARLHQQVQRLAVLEDRERIAKELHDGVVQSLFAVGMALQAAEMASDDEAVRGRLASAVEEIDAVIRDLRGYIFGLRPGLLADRELDRAVREAVEGLAQGSGVELAVEIDPQVAARLSTRAGDVVQVAREATSNAVRHAEARRVRVRLLPAQGGAVLEVTDDGAGFDPRAVTGTGQGLINLESRASALGGRLEIDSAPGHGTRVRIDIPL